MRVTENRAANAIRARNSIGTPEDLPGTEDQQRLAAKRFLHARRT